MNLLSRRLVDLPTEGLRRILQPVLLATEKVDTEDLGAALRFAATCLEAGEYRQLVEFAFGPDGAPLPGSVDHTTVFAATPRPDTCGHEQSAIVWSRCPSRAVPRTHGMDVAVRDAATDLRRRFVVRTRVWPVCPVSGEPLELHHHVVDLGGDVSPVVYSAPVCLSCTRALGDTLYCRPSTVVG